MAGKKSFGGYAVKFSGCAESLESVKGWQTDWTSGDDEEALGVYQETPAREQVRDGAVRRSADGRSALLVRLSGSFCPNQLSVDHTEPPSKE